MSSHVATDIGGTFTDLVELDETTGSLRFAKVSTTPKDLAQGVIDVVESGAVDLAEVSALAHGTTVVINTLTALRAKAIRRIEIRFSDNAKIDNATIQEISDIENVNDVGFLDNTLRCAVTGSVDALIKYISKHKVESLLTREDDLESMFLSYYGKK